MQEDNSYKQILKATTLFGGVQIINIIIAIIRSKFIAVLLGPTGMGIAGLLTSTTGLISGLTNFGLGTSAVKNVADANGTGNQIRVFIIITVLQRWVWITGLLGSIITIVLSSWLSQITFGNKDYTTAFIYLSVTLLLNQLSSGQMVVLQGLRKLQYLAKASLSGSIAGLLISIPMYYLWNIKAIVPAIIISSCIALFFSWYFSHKIKFEPAKVSKVRTIAEGKNMLFMGFMISLSSLITIGVGYLVRIFISRTGGVEQVGLYTAGFAIIITYVGLIFNAMATDYYPRLSAVAHSNELSKKAMNEQAEIAILIIAPIIMIFLVFIKWLIILLYSTHFIAVNAMIHWAALGMLFKAASWSIAFILLAKSASKLFFWNELLANVYMLLFNIIGYRLGGLEGLGISFMLVYFVYLIQVFVLANVKYSFSFNKDFIRIFVIQLFLAFICFLIMKLMAMPYSYIAGSFFIVISAWFSFKELDKRIGINAIWKVLRSKLINKMRI
ncbi:MAG: oligosaccharide flippase family protein [Bacteroidales bacterium]|nr:oligosaccharide flippase family protein [Bacteroidales bacterium]